MGPRGLDDAVTVVFAQFVEATGQGAGIARVDALIGTDAQAKDTARARTWPAALDSYPALLVARRQLIEDARTGVHADQLAAVIESDPMLTFAALRLASHRAEREVASVREAVDALPAATIAAMAESTPEFELLDPTGRWGRVPEYLCMHALAVRNTAERLGRILECHDRDELVAAALLHDIGKIPLSVAWVARGAPPLDPAGTPEGRLERERSEFGTDHAELGAEIARRAGLPDQLADAIGHHHHNEGDDVAAIVGVADALVHYRNQNSIDLAELLRRVAALGLPRDDLSSLIYDMTEPVAGQARAVMACPLSARELEVVRLLAAGMVPKQIAQALALSTSTVRNHLHRIYTRLGVSHRTQAVVLATERGWI